MVHPVPVITDQPLFTVGFPTFHQLVTGAVMLFCILRLLLSRKNTLMVQYQREQKAKIQVVVPLTVECVKGFTRQRKTLKNIFSTMLNIVHTNAHSATKASSSPAI